MIWLFTKKRKLFLKNSKKKKKKLGTYMEKKIKRKVARKKNINQLRCMMKRRKKTQSLVSLTKIFRKRIKQKIAQKGIDLEN